MQEEHLIPLDSFCVYHNIEYSFIHSLHENGLIEITTKEEGAFIPETNLGQVEKLIRLHHDLQVNLEGVEVITYLLDQLRQQQHEINQLQNKLRFYEI